MYRFLISLITTPLQLLLKGYVLLKLWAWFVVPFGIMNIGMSHALGLCIIAKMLTYVPIITGKEMDRTKDEERNRWLLSLIYGFSSPLHAG